LRFLFTNNVIHQEREVHLPRGHEEVQQVAFSHDGRQLASGSYDHFVQLWDASTKKCFQTLTGHRGIVNSVAFSPDGRRLASGSDDSTIRLWDTSATILALGSASRRSRAIEARSIQWCSHSTGCSWHRALATTLYGSGTPALGITCRRSRVAFVTLLLVLMARISSQTLGSSV
jgi:WD40 repeat protein